MALKATLLALVLGLVGAYVLRQRLASYVSIMAVPLPRRWPMRPSSWWGPRAGGAGLGAVCRGGRALAAPALAAPPAHEPRRPSRVKEVEGNLEIKQKVRARMREMAKRRMLAAVPKADLVVMNPTHYAVALKVRGRQDGRAACGGQGRRPAGPQDPRHRQGRQGAGAAAAAAAGPRALRPLQAGPEIPARSCAAVAQVLAYVYQLRAALRARMALPVGRTRTCPSLDPTTTRTGSRTPMTVNGDEEAKGVNEMLAKLQSCARPARRHPGGARCAHRRADGARDDGAALPPLVLDLLFTFNIAMAVMVMMVAANMVRRWTSRPSRWCCC